MNLLSNISDVILSRLPAPQIDLICFYYIKTLVVDLSCKYKSKLSAWLATIRVMLDVYDLGKITLGEIQAVWPIHISLYYNTFMEVMMALEILWLGQPSKPDQRSLAE